LGRWTGWSLRPRETKKIWRLIIVWRGRGGRRRGRRRGSRRGRRRRGGRGLRFRQGILFLNLLFLVGMDRRWMLCSRIIWMLISLLLHLLRG